MEQGAVESRIPQPPSRRSMLPAPRAYSSSSSTKMVPPTSTNSKVPVAPHGRTISLAPSSHAAAGAQIPASSVSSTQQARRISPPVRNESHVPGENHPDMQVGSRVCIGGSKIGTLRYFGRTHLTDGIFCGIELVEPEGKHNGTVQGVTYFSCQDGYGIFAPVAKVELVESKTTISETPSQERPTRPKSAEFQPKHTEVKRGIPRPKSALVQKQQGSETCSSAEPLARPSKLLPPKSYKKLDNHQSDNESVVTFNSKEIHQPKTEVVSKRAIFSSDESKHERETTDNVNTKPKKSSIPMKRKEDKLAVVDSEGLQRSEPEGMKRVRHDHSVDDHTSSDYSNGLVASESFEFLMCARMSSSTSIDGILSPGTLKDHDLIPDFLTEYEQKQGKTTDFLSSQDIAESLRKKSDSENTETKNGVGEIFIPDEPFDGNVVTSASFHAEICDMNDDYIPPAMTDSMYSEHFSDGNIPNPKKSEQNLDEWEMDGSNSEESDMAKSQESNSNTEMTHSAASTVEMVRSYESAMVESRSPETDLLKKVIDPHQATNSYNLVPMTNSMESQPAQDDILVEQHLNIKDQIFGSGETDIDEGMGQSTQEESTDALQSISSAVIKGTDLSKRVSLEEDLDEGMVKSSQEVGHHLARGHSADIAVFATDVDRSYHTLSNAPNYVDDKSTAFEGDTSKAMQDASNGEKVISIPTSDQLINTNLKEDSILTSVDLTSCTKQDRPISSITVSSTDTGYQGDYDIDSAQGSPTRDNREFRHSVVSNASADFDEDTTEKHNRGAQIIDGQLFNYDVICETSDVPEEVTEVHNEMADDAEGSGEEMCCETEVDENEIKAMVAESTEISEEITDNVDKECIQDFKESDASTCQPSVALDTKQETSKVVSQTSNLEDAKTKEVKGKGKRSKSKEPESTSSTTTSVNESSSSRTGKERKKTEKKQQVVSTKNVAELNCDLNNGDSPKESEKSKKKQLEKKSARTGVGKHSAAKVAPKSTVGSSVTDAPAAPDLSKVRSKVFESKPVEPTKKIVRQPKKPNKWDAVAAKIAAGLQEEKMKPKKKNEVKSKVLAKASTSSSASRESTPAPRQKMRLTAVLNEPAKPSEKTSEPSEDQPATGDATDSVVIEQTEQITDEVADHGTTESDVKHEHDGEVKTENHSEVTRELDSSLPCITELNSTDTKSIEKKVQSSKKGTAIPASQPVARTSQAKPGIASRRAALVNNKESVTGQGKNKKDAKAATNTTTTNKRTTSSVFNADTAATRAKKAELQRMKQEQIRITPEDHEVYNRTVVLRRKKAQKDQTRTKQQQKNGNIVRSGGIPDVLPPAQSRINQAQQEISRLEGVCDARSKELSTVKLQLAQCEKAFDAMTILVRYLTEQLNAFETPHLKSQLAEVNECLIEANKTIVDLKLEQESLQREIVSLTDRHHCQVVALENSHQEVLESLRSSFAQQQKEIEMRLDKEHKKDIEDLKLIHDKEISELEMLNEMHREDLSKSHDRQQNQLKEKHNLQLRELKDTHKKEMLDLKSTHELDRQDLEVKLFEYEEQFELLQQKSKEFEEAMLKDTDTKIQTALAQFKDLPKEVESLKAVVEMRNDEIRELRNENNRIKKELEELPIARERITFLEQRAEDLSAMVCITKESQRQLTQEQIKLRANYNKESHANKRLSMENEQLQWRLAVEIESPDIQLRSSKTASLSPSQLSRSSEGDLADDTQSVFRKNRSPTTPTGGSKVNYASLLTAQSIPEPSSEEYNSENGVADCNT